MNISEGGPAFRGKPRAPRDGEILSRAAELHFGREMTVAWMYVAADGGPVRRIITGRHRKPTGRLVLSKAGHRAMPWESMAGEMVFLEIAEVATPIHSIMVQPHRLEMNVMRSDILWDYTPDARVVTDEAFANDLVAGIPFADAVAAWHPRRATGRTRTIIIEIKSDVDPRIDDPRYRTKLRLASEVYAGLGYDFVELVQTRDLVRPFMWPAVHKFFLWRDTALVPSDIEMAQEIVGEGTRLGALLDGLGRGSAALAKVAALHCGRVFCVSLANGLSDDSDITVVRTAA